MANTRDQHRHQRLTDGLRILEIITNAGRWMSLAEIGMKFYGYRIVNDSNEQKKIRRMLHALCKSFPIEAQTENGDPKPDGRERIYYRLPRGWYSRIFK